jgi:hypothetical protein
VLINTLDVGQITKYTIAPVAEEPSYPFLNWSVDAVISWAEQHLDRRTQGIVPYELAILDSQTLEDKTCLLVTVKDGQHATNPENPERLIVRSDFRSSLVTLNVKVQAVGSDGHFETTAADGVVRHYE